MAINIKPANRGKFTAKAKAADQGVQEYARHVLASPSASPATKKQANFARNASKWKRGGKQLRKSSTRNTILER